MQCSVSVVVEIAAEADVAEMERSILEAGWQAMRQALVAAVRAYEAAHPACPRCGSAHTRSHGTVRRQVQTRFGRVALQVRRQICGACQQRFRPAQGCLQSLGRSRVTAELAAACAVAGASWPYATAARVLRQLSGAQISHEELRQLCGRAGRQEAAAQQAEAEQSVRMDGAMVRADRERPARLVVGLDGGWVPSRDQAGGMEGKVAVVATGTQPVGTHGRQRLTPRRYVATFGPSEQVGSLSYAAAVALGGQDAREQIVLGDGAEWIKTQAAWHFPDAVGILDWAHVARTMHKAIRAACPGSANRARRRQLHQTLPDALWHGDVDAALAALSALRPPPSTPPAESPPVLEAAITYLQGQRMWLGDYAAWQDAGYPVGSGLIERAVALVINRRMKRRGMRWRRDNASAVVALRVRELNAEWEAQDRLSPLAA